MAYDAVSSGIIKVGIDIIDTDMYLLQLGFQPVAIVGRLVQK